MKKEEIHLDDIKRILFGQAPPIFLLEVLIRTIIIYLFLLFVTRWLGKRMSGQLTITEMAVMLTLGAVVSVGMQIPDRGVLLSMFVLVCILIFQKGITWLGYENARIEELTQGKLSILVKNGVMQLDEMKSCRLSKQQLFAELRSSNVYNLGKVERMYLEACGVFSVFTTTDEKPGLPVFPPDYKDILTIQRGNACVVCINCGLIKEKNATATPCKNCGHDKWIDTII